jgi:hypothetical protein
MPTPPCSWCSWLALNSGTATLASTATALAVVNAVPSQSNPTYVFVALR